jgi:UDP-2-acetamido-2-deoxy-ribo-hexuluronate aminotransferase
MADQPAYRELVRCHDIPIARNVAQHVVSLPMYPDMTEEVQEQIISAVKTAVL